MNDVRVSIVGEVRMLALVDNSPMMFIQVYEPQKETPAQFSAKAKKSWVKNTSTLVKPTMMLFTNWSGNHHEGGLHGGRSQLWGATRVVYPHDRGKPRKR